MFIHFSVLYNLALLILSRSIIYLPMNAKTTLLYISVHAVFYLFVMRSITRFPHTLLSIYFESNCFVQVQ